MDSELARLIELDTPKLSPLICNGLAIEHMKDIDKYVDQMFRVASKGFPEGLTYNGFKRCTPQEEFYEVTKKKGPKRTFDVARSDIFMVKFFFTYKGEELPPRYINLPFVSDAGCIVLGGSRFNISPILSDRVISVGVSNIFVRLLRARLTFERTSQHYIIDGRRETVQTVWALIYNKSARMKKLRPTVKANTTMMHYLFCKYGFADTFLRFGNCRPVLGGEEINKTSYPEEEWVICSSTQAKPKYWKGYYTPAIVRVAVRKEELTPAVRNMLGGFFYIADYFPTRIVPERIKSVNEKREWMVLMGHILFSGTIHEGELHDAIADHLASLDAYLDDILISKLFDIGVEVNDIYQLFAVIVEKFNDWLLAAADKVNSMLDKELSIRYYTMYQISAAIFNLYFKLKAASKKDLTAKEIITMMNMTLKTGLVYSMTRNHGEVSTISSPGDNKAFKITSMLVPQAGSNRLNGKKDRTMISDPAMRLHSSVAEIGCYANLPKSAPDGRSRINPFLDVGPKGEVLRKPEHIELMDQVQAMIAR